MITGLVVAVELTGVWCVLVVFPVCFGSKMEWCKVIVGEDFMGRVPLSLVCRAPKSVDSSHV